MRKCLAKIQGLERRMSQHSSRTSCFSTTSEPATFRPALLFYARTQSSPTPRTGPRCYDSDDEDTDQSTCREFFTPEEAGEKFVRALMELNREVCVLCFYASTARVVGTCRNLAAHPDKGHLQRKLDKVLGTHGEDGRCYEIDIAVHVKIVRWADSRSCAVCTSA